VLQHLRRGSFGFLVDLHRCLSGPGKASIASLSQPFLAIAAFLLFTQVRALYRAKGWNFNMATVEQCKTEGYYGDLKGQLDGNEGCNIYGHMEVPKVQGASAWLNLC
jgi:hypothetical protein